MKRILNHFLVFLSGFIICYLIIQEVYSECIYIKNRRYNNTMIESRRESLLKLTKIHAEKVTELDSIADIKGYIYTKH